MLLRVISCKNLDCYDFLPKNIDQRGVGKRTGAKDL